MSPNLVQLLSEFIARADLPIPQGERLLVFFRIALEHDPTAVKPLTNLIQSYLSAQNHSSATPRPLGSTNPMDSP